MTRHRADDTVDKAIGRVLKADLVVVEDIGLPPVPVEAAKALFRVIDAAAYERRSIAISSKVHPGSTSCYQPHSRPRGSTGSCTTLTSWSPRATATGSQTPSTARGDTTDLTHVGRSVVRQRGAFMSASGEISCPSVGSSTVDTWCHHHATTHLPLLNLKSPM